MGKYCLCFFFFKFSFCCENDVVFAYFQMLKFGTELCGNLLDPNLSFDDSQ